MARDDDIARFGRDLGLGLEKVRKTISVFRHLGARLDPGTRQHLAWRLERYAEDLTLAARSLRGDKAPGEAGSEQEGPAKG